MFIFFLLGLLLAANAKKITVEVVGKFLCHNNQVPVYIELREHDWITDDLLAWTSVMTPEIFRLTGTENEMRSINPFLVIKHTCRGYPEKLIVDFGHIKRNILVNFDELDLEEPALVKLMQEKVIEEIRALNWL
ncbi:hypothetical protein GCK32_009568 [Trichostrongylus colubriformis]|uniref:Transthyretin-like family protein n=1 Tax=Trichostrongylus colubriformis TaxID=6319 RepID=A0AAN8FIR4_TRICO